jgi:Fe-S-cluster containining protein
MTETYTETVVRCGRCGAELKDDEIRFLWSDVDFMEHGDHYACIDPEHEQAYFRKARWLVLGSEGDR